MNSESDFYWTTFPSKTSGVWRKIWVVTEILMDTTLTVYCECCALNGAPWEPSLLNRFLAGTDAIVCCREVPSTAAIDHEIRRTQAIWFWKFEKQSTETFAVSFVFNDAVYDEGRDSVFHGYVSRIYEIWKSREFPRPFE